MTTIQSRAEKQEARPLVAVVAGSGLVARCAIDAGADLLLALNAGMYRTHGVGTLAAFLPLGDANEQTDRLLRWDVLPHAKSTPVFAGLFCGDDESSLIAYLDRWREWGVGGIVNWPALGFVDGEYGRVLQENGFNTEAESKLLTLAKSRGFQTLGFALSNDQLESFLDAGVDGLILNLGLTKQLDDVRDRRDQMQQAVTRMNEMLNLANRLKPNVPCLAFGGPITTADDLKTLMRQTSVHGFAGGSVFERLPVEAAITSTIHRFQSSMETVDYERSARGFGPMIGRSPEMLEVFDLIKRVAGHSVNVCIEGESGTGKELVAAQIHRLSRRHAGPFITLNCGAIPDSLLESELFGHEKGAFTDADRRRRGKFELADSGTLFLDEVADLSPRGQVALLRVIQQQEVTPIGSEVSRSLDVRVLTASNRPLREQVEQGLFREDLYYRLNQITLKIPPLRSRRDDLTLLAQEIARRLHSEMNRKSFDISPAFQNKLLQHSWPGNFRELEGVLRESAIREDGDVLHGRHFIPDGISSSSGRQSDDSHRPITPVLDLENSLAGDTTVSNRMKAEAAVQQCHGNKTLAAKTLGISRKTLYCWLKEDNVD
ncbi:phosphoenolpyruvate hydrolase family protein [Thalassoglobus sp. JC818]|uniref:phosphoenolpyruvate hydrolase family protein n=1 Tax=Thalassoglobus sp. JC818 TaxID=3232136 RepID=UPI0034582B34